MPLVVPNPTVPTNGQALDATPLLQNLQAVYAAIQSFDGSQVQAGSLVASAFNSNINPNTLMHDISSPFVQTGCIWSIVSGLQVTMTGGVIYPETSIGMFRTVVNAVASYTPAANTDTYVDIDNNGNITYQGVTNNSASPALTANSIRVAIIVSGASTITIINQGSVAVTAPVVSSNVLTVSDSLGNLIYPRNPNPGIIGFRQSNSVFTTTNASGAQITGLSLPVVIPAGGRNVKITAYTPDISNSLASSNYGMSLWDGVVASGTQLVYGGINNNVGGSTSANLTIPMHLSCIASPPAGLKTYNLGAFTANGTVTVSGIVGGPTLLIVELE